MITIYGDPGSGNCLKVKWTAEHLGIPFDWKTIDVTKAETRTPAFLALNPAGQVPTVVLADGSPLVPADAYQRAKMLEWMFWEQYSHEPSIAVARFQMKYLGKRRDELDPKLVERGQAALARLEQGLEGDFLVGGRVSLADISLVAYTRMAGDGGFKLSDYPAIGAWIARIEAAIPIRDPA